MDVELMGSRHGRSSACVNGWHLLPGGGIVAAVFRESSEEEICGSEVRVRSSGGEG